MDEFEPRDDSERELIRSAGTGRKLTATMNGVIDVVWALIQLVVIVTLAILVWQFWFS